MSFFMVPEVLYNANLCTRAIQCYEERPITILVSAIADKFELNQNNIIFLINITGASHLQGYWFDVYSSFVNQLRQLTSKLPHVHYNLKVNRSNILVGLFLCAYSVTSVTVICRKYLI